MSIKKTLNYWIPLVVVISLMSGFIYTTAQQVYRTSANDPQLQIAQDTAHALANGSSPASIIPHNIVDLSESLAPFIIIFDENGNPIASSGELHNAIPSVPKGVFSSAKNAEDRFTWQPEKGIRMATDVIYFSGKQSGYVLAARSLREVENRITDLTNMVIIGWVFSLIVSLITIIATTVLLSKKE